MAEIITLRVPFVNTFCGGARNGAPDNPTMDFGSRLKRLREAAGLNQEQLALKCERSGQAWISNFESGQRRPRFEDIPVLARALGVHPGELFSDLPATSQPVGFDMETLAFAHQMLRESYADQVPRREPYSVETEPDLLVETYFRLLKVKANPAEIAALGRSLGRHGVEDERDAGAGRANPQKGRKRAAR
jgi:transcriptional regulator with XRE-family HTH domain